MNVAKVKQLRSMTGVSMALCSQALGATDDDIEKAIEHLRKAGELRSSDVVRRATNNGAVVAYIHPGSTLGVLVQVECETDFVAKGENFQAFCHDVAMHIAATKPMFISATEAKGTPWATKEYEFIVDQVAHDPKLANKPAEMRAKIANGKYDKVLREVCLMDQPFIKDPTKTIDQLRAELVLKTGENVKVARMIRFDVKEGK